MGSAAGYGVCIETQTGVDEMKLSQNEFGNVTREYPAVWFRVSTWATGRFVADFTTRVEAEKFAIEDAKGLRYDHKVSTMRLAS